jgi:hypothetical protein
MADEVVSIKLKVEAHDRQLKELLVKLKAVEQMERRLASGRRMESFASGQSRAVAGMTASWKRHFDSVDGGIKMMGKGLTGFLRKAIKGVIVEMGLLGVSMMAVHAAFVAGQLIMKAYHGMMQVVAGGAAGLTVALAAVSAAIREQQAAIYAYRGKGANEFGSAMNQTRMGMRALQADAGLATLGIDALNQAYGTMSKTMNVKQIAGSTGALKALMDFGSAGQDPAKGLEMVAEVVAALNDPKKGFDAVASSAKKLGPEMEKALKAANIKTKGQFQELLYSGKLAEMGGVAGQFGAVNSTLIAQLKSYMTQVRTMFADYGDQFLEPLKVAFGEIFMILKRDMAKIFSAVELTIGADGYIDGFVGMIDKTSNFMVKMIREYLPKAVGMFGRISEWFDKFKNGWNAALDYLRPLIDGARVLYGALEPVWEAIKGGADNLFLMKDLLVENSDSVEEFGSRIGGLITAVSDLFMGLKKMFFDVLPLINDVIGGITQVFKMISGLLTGGAGGGLFKALAPLLAFSVIGRGLQNVKGRMLPSIANKMNTMSVQAGVVNITGPSGAVGTAPLASGRAGIPGGYGGYGMAPAALSSGAGGIAPGAMMPLNFAAMRGMPGMRFGEAVGYGSTLANRNSNYQMKMSSYGAQLAANPGFFAPLYGQGSLKSSMDNLKTRSKMGLVAANYRTRAGLGRIGGAYQYMMTGGYNNQTGQYENPQAQKQLINMRHQLRTGQITPAQASQQLAGMGFSNTDIKKQLNIAGPQTSQGRIGKGFANARRMLDLNRVTRSSTKFGMGMNKFSSSMTGRMGTSLGLGMASQYAPEEMRGAMALGGMVGMFNPRAGIAVAGLGGALNARSAGSGLLAGAAGGAAAGSFFGPMGAAVGAGLGAIFGAWRGAMNKSRIEIEAAKKFAQETIGTLYSGIASAAGRKLTQFEETLKAGGTIAPGTEGAFQNLPRQFISGGQTLFNKFSQGASPDYQRLVGYSSTLRKQIDSAGGALTSFEIQDMINALPGIKSDEASRMISQITSGNNYEDFLKVPLELASEKKFSKEGALAIIKDMVNNQGTYGIEMDDKKIEDALKRPVEFLNEMEGQITNNAAEFGFIQEQTTARMDLLSKMTGKTVPELEIMAKELGFNLYDASVSFNDVLQKMGAAVLKTGSQFKFAMQDVFLSGAESFKASIQAAEAVTALDQSATTLAQLLKSGASEEEKKLGVNQFMSDYFNQMLTASGGDAIAAYLNTRTLYGQGPQGGAFAEGEVFAGQGQYFQTPEAGEAFAKLDREMPKLAAEQIAAYIYQTTGKAVDVGSLIPMIGQMDNDQLQKLLTDLQTLDTTTAVYSGMGGFTETNTMKNIGATATEEEIKNTINKYFGEDGTAGGLLKFLDTDTETLDQVSVAISGLDKTILEQFPQLEERVKTLNEYLKGYFEGDGGDTSTPRGGGIGDTASRLSQTMSRHQAMDSQLTGKRTITSAFRTWGLGSINSDHVTGRAYDLVGQNLGNYAKLVHANGGFAEFHGAAANRHLHVVPGSGIGDDSAPQSRVMSNSGTGGINNYYTFEINGGNQSPEAIAQMVMMKIKETERVQRERM